MGITVREAMTIGGLAKCKLVAGEKGIDREIKYVTVMEVPDTIQWLKGKDFLLTSLYPIRDNPQALETLVSQLDKVNSAALAIKTYRFFDQIPEIILREADRLGFPVIEIDTDVSYIDIMTPLMNEILESSSQKQEDIEGLLNWISELALGGKGLETIVSSLTQVLDNIVTIESEIEFINPIPKYDVVPLDNQEKNKLYKSKRPLRMIRTIDDKTLPCIVAPLILNQQMSGYITCWETNRDFRKIDFMVMERMIPLLALEFLKVKTKIDVEQKYKNEFLSEILLGNIRESAVLVNKAKIYGWDLLRDYQVVILNMDQFNSIVTEHDNNEVFIQELKNKVIHSTDGLVRSRFSKSIVGGWSDNIIILLPVEQIMKEKGTNLKETVHSLVSQFVDRLKRMITGLSFTVGIGRVYPAVQGIHLGYRDAIQSIHLGREVWGRNTIIHFDDLGIYRILSQFEGRDELVSLYQETIGKLVDYDKECNSHLTKTLSEYFKQNGGLTEASKGLFVHVNTLKYRLNKIEQLTGYSVNESEGRLHLHIGLKIKSLLEKA